MFGNLDDFFICQKGADNIICKWYKDMDFFLFFYFFLLYYSSDLISFWDWMLSRTTIMTFFSMYTVIIMTFYRIFSRTIDNIPKEEYYYQEKMKDFIKHIWIIS